MKRFSKQLKRLELIVQDELGYVPFFKAGAELLFTVAGRAYERTSLMFTTNLPYEEWVEIMGSAGLTGVLLDRLTHRQGPDERLTTPGPMRRYQFIPGRPRADGNDRNDQSSRHQRRTCAPDGRLFSP